MEILWLKPFIFFIVYILHKGRMRGNLYKKPSEKHPNKLYYSDSLKGFFRRIYLGLEIDLPFEFKILPLETTNGTSTREFFRNSQLLPQNFFEEWTILTNHPQQMDKCLEDNQFREALLSLLKNDAQKIHISFTYIWITLKKNRVNNSSEELEKTLDTVQTVATSIKNNASQQTDSLDKNLKRLLPTFTGLFFLTILANIINKYSGIIILEQNKEVYISLSAGIILIICTLIIIQKSFRSSTWKSKIYLHFKILGLVGILGLSFNITQDINAIFGRHAIEFYQPKILKKSCALKCTAGRRSSTFTIGSGDHICSSIPREKHLNQYKKDRDECTEHEFIFSTSIQHPYRPKKALIFKVKEHVFDRTIEGGYARTPIYKGNLGIKWLDTNELTSIY